MQRYSESTQKTVKMFPGLSLKTSDRKGSDRKGSTFEQAKSVRTTSDMASSAIALINKNNSFLLKNVFTKIVIRGCRP